MTDLLLLYEQEKKPGGSHEECMQGGHTAKALGKG
jgi:hypothetical protein